MCICGTSKTGKTYKSLAIGSSMIATLQAAKCCEGNGRIALLDTEHESAAKYADMFEFDHDKLESFKAELFIDKIGEAARAGYSLLIVDSITHEWAGRGGILEYQDVLASTVGYNKYTAWNRASPKHNAFLDAIIRYPFHVICTCRAKIDYALSDGEVHKLGLGPIQRDTTEYEFDVFAWTDSRYALKIGGSRCRYLTDRVFTREETEEVGVVLGNWIAGAINLDEIPENPSIPLEIISELKEMGRTLKFSAAKWLEILSGLGVSSFARLQPEDATRLKTQLSDKIARLRKD